MTLVASRTATVSRYYRLRDAHIAAGGIVPCAVYQLAIDGRHEEAFAQLRAAVKAPVPPRREAGGRTVDLAQLRNNSLARFADELHEAGPDQLDHLARRAEMPGDLGHRMQELVDEERARRVFTVALMPLPPEGDQPQAGPARSNVLPERVPAVYAAVAGRFGGVQPDFPRGALGFDFWAAREERWDAAGRIGDPSDPEFDEVFLYLGGEDRG